MRSARPSLINGVLAAVALIASDAWAQDWQSAGADLNNSRYQVQGDKLISANTVGSLKLKWTFTTDGDVVAHPAVDGDYLYFPDSAGFLYKVHKKTGAQVWKKPIAGYTGITGDFARATPAVAGNLLILGNQSGKLQDRRSRRACSRWTRTPAIWCGTRRWTPRLTPP